MIKIRFVKKLGHNYYDLIDSAELPSFKEGENSVNNLALEVGKLLSKYIDMIPDVSMINNLSNKSITDWIYTDLLCVRTILGTKEMDLFITEEDQAEIPTEPNDLIYLLIDESVKLNGVMPTSSYLVRHVGEKFDIRSVIDSLVSKELFPESKFKTNLIKFYRDRIGESTDATFVYDQYNINKLYDAFSLLDLTLYAIRLT